MSIVRQASDYMIYSLWRPAITPNDADVVTTSCSARPSVFPSVTILKLDGIAGCSNVLNMLKNFWEIASYPRKTQLREINRVEWEIRLQGPRFQSNDTILCDYNRFIIVLDLVHPMRKIVYREACCIYRELTERCEPLKLCLLHSHCPAILNTDQLIKLKSSSHSYDTLSLLLKPEDVMDFTLKRFLHIYMLVQGYTIVIQEATSAITSDSVIN